MYCLIYQTSSCPLKTLLRSQWYIHAGWCMYLPHEGRAKANRSSKLNRKEDCSAMIENVFSKPWMQSHQPNECGLFILLQKVETVCAMSSWILRRMHQRKKVLFLLSPCAMTWSDPHLVLVWNGRTQIKPPPCYTVTAKSCWWTLLEDI